MLESSLPPAEQPAEQFSRWQVLITILSVESLLLMAAILLSPEGEMQRLLVYLDFLLCLALLADFSVRLAQAKGRRMAFLGRDKGILDLMGSLPLAEEFHWARVARLWRIARIISTIGSLRLLYRQLRRQPLELTFVATLAVIATLIICGSLLVLHWESTHPDGNITTAQITLWWMMETLSTIGYGDYYPVTVGGRIVAALMMISGIGLFGTFTAWVATPLLQRGD